MVKIATRQKDKRIEQTTRKCSRQRQSFEKMRELFQKNCYLCKNIKM